jgi:hypothetical protein
LSHPFLVTVTRVKFSVRLRVVDSATESTSTPSMIDALISAMPKADGYVPEAMYAAKM